MLKMLVHDKVFILCAIIDFAFIMGTHYLMEKYHWCTEGIALCGRYTTGVSTILGASGAWLIFHPGATAYEMFTVTCACAVIAGLSTLFFYLIDDHCAKNAAEADLEMAGLKIKG